MEARHIVPFRHEWWHIVTSFCFLIECFKGRHREGGNVTSSLWFFRALFHAAEWAFSTLRLATPWTEPCEASADLHSRLWHFWIHLHLHFLLFLLRIWNELQLPSYSQQKHAWVRALALALLFQSRRIGTRHLQLHFLHLRKLNSNNERQQVCVWERHIVCVNPSAWNRV